MSEFFFRMPQNPYLFAILFVLGVISSWKPIKEALIWSNSFIKNVVTQGFVDAARSVSHNVNKKAISIYDSPSGSLHYLILLFDCFKYGVLAAVYAFLSYMIEKSPVPESIIFYTLKTKRPIDESDFTLLMAAFLVLIFAVRFFYQLVLNVKIHRLIRDRPENK